MKISYYSDLHLECLLPNEIKDYIQEKFSSIPNENEICVLAGDIGYPRETHYDEFMKFISNRFTKTFVIPGNHEYYHKTCTVEETNQFMEDYFQPFENITFLNNSYEYYDDTCFIGSVLWSHIDKPQYTINDVKMIPHLDVAKYNQLNQSCVDFLENTIHSHKDKKCIVITHHMPSYSLIDAKYRVPMLLPYNQWFACSMEHLFVPQIESWIYGHTHMPSNKIIQGIHFLCNPKGYPYE